MRYVAGILSYTVVQVLAAPTWTDPPPVCSCVFVYAGPQGSVRRDVPRHGGRRHCRHLDSARTVAAQHVRRCVPVHGEAPSHLEGAVGVWPIPSDSQTVQGESQERENSEARGIASPVVS